MFFPKLDKQSLTDGIVIPQMVKVHQAFPHKDLADPVGTLKQQLLALDEKTTASLPGKRIGITAGSRGLPHYKEIKVGLFESLLPNYLEGMFAHSHTEMEHRIFCPILLQLFNGKSLKEFFLSFEITL